MELIKSVSGIRGIYNKSLFIEDIISHAAAFSQIQEAKSLPILIARDSRISGFEITERLKQELNKIGRNVIDCGIIPTPTAQFITQNFDIAGSIVITASHNPKEWNGMKFIDCDGTFIDKNKNAKLFKTALIKNDFKINQNSNITSSSFIESIDLHLENVLNIDFLNVDKIKNKKFKIVLDTINGAACTGFKKLLKKLNCEIIHINSTPNGLFKRDPEPKTSNLNELVKIVKKNSANLALITDPDGDRLALIDEKGKIVIEENTLVLCIKEYLEKTNDTNPIVTNLSTTSAVDEVAMQYNTKVIRTSVGEINVVNGMKKHNSVIGGEGNGGVILKNSHLGRDAFVASAIILNHLATNDLLMSEAINNIPKFYMLKEKIEINPEIDAQLISQKIKNTFIDYSFNEIDGIKAINKDSWLHIRQSNTEPIIRVYIESKKEENLSIIFNKVNSIFNDNK